MPETVFKKLEFIELPVTKMIGLSEKFLSGIQQRKTIRKFSERKVPIEVLENCILAAGSAPSGANRQPWHFTVVSNPAIKKEIRIAAEKEEKEFYEHRATPEWLRDLQPLGTDEHKPFLETAPHLIAIFQQNYALNDDGTLRKNYYATESVGIATGFLITALHFSGVASLTHTPSPMKFLNRILNRPAGEKPFLLLVVGYPASDAKVPEINKYPLDKIASFINEKDDQTD